VYIDITRELDIIRLNNTTRGRGWGGVLQGMGYALYTTQYANISLLSRDKRTPYKII